MTLFQGPANEEALELKHECESALHGIDHEIKAYRDDNIRFNSKSFVDDCKLARYKLTFCSAGAHHQNGIGEETIKQMSEDARVSLLHDKREWPKVITTNLLPFTLKLAVDNNNHLSMNEDGLHIISISAGME